MLGKVLDSVAERLTNLPGKPINENPLGPLDMRGLAHQVHGQVTQSPLTFALKMHEVTRAMASSGAASKAGPAKDEQNARLLAVVLYYYLDALFNNKYVDRMGTAIPAPAMSATVSDTEIAAVVTVFVDALMDFADRRPVWVEAGTPTAPFSPSDYAAKNSHYYPYMGAETANASGGKAGAKGADGQVPGETAAAPAGHAEAKAAPKLGHDAAQPMRVAKKATIPATPVPVQAAAPASPAAPAPAGTSEGSKIAVPTAVAFEYDPEILDSKVLRDETWAPVQALYGQPQKPSTVSAPQAAGATDAADGEAAAQAEAAMTAATPASAAYCGLDANKAKAVYYVSQLVNQSVSGMTGLTVGSFGGVGVSLGVFGKLSFGDNKTVEAVLKAVLARLGQRVATEAAIKILWAVDDSGWKSPSELVIGYLTVAKSH
ncbi:hypothetical protein [Pararobbsia alpina]|uniref:hypothetical protein n=1 Tax=Pararobbsia alpina TaxID=621374 RepID=UPI0039A662D9